MSFTLALLFSGSDVTDRLSNKNTAKLSLPKETIQGRHTSEKLSQLLDGKVLLVVKGFQHGITVKMLDKGREYCHLIVVAGCVTLLLSSSCQLWLYWLHPESGLFIIVSPPKN